MLSLPIWIATVSLVHAQSEVQTVFDPALLLEPQQALQNGDAKKALKLLDVIENSWSCPSHVADSSVLAQLWIYRGYAYYILGEDALISEMWQQAVSIKSDVEFDKNILRPSDDVESVFDFFLQNQNWVLDQGGLDLYVPEAIGEAKLFIDGRTANYGDAVKSGTHLAQVVCPQDGLQSRWFDFQSAFNWFEMCPSGVDTTVQVESDDFGAMFGGGPDISEYYNPAPVCPSEGFFFNPDFSKVDPVVLGTSGVGIALLGAGVLSYYQWVMPAFADVESARLNTSITTDEAQSISSAFNTARWATLGMLTTGTLLSTYGLYTGVLTSSPVLPQVGAGWIGFSGQF